MQICGYYGRPDLTGSGRVQHDDEPSAARRGREPCAHGALYPDVLPVARDGCEGPRLRREPRRGGSRCAEHRLVRWRRYHRGHVRELNLEQGRILALH